MSPQQCSAFECIGMMTSRMEQFAAEARSGDQAVRKLRQEAGELKAALASSQADCNHLRQQMRASLASPCPHHAQRTAASICLARRSHMAGVLVLSWRSCLPVV